MDDGANDIDNNTSPRPAKRQRSASPCCEPDLRYTSMLPLSHKGDVEGSKGNADDSDELGDDDILSKRRKLADALAGKIALSSHNGRSRHSPSSTLEDNESGSSAVDSILASTARTTPDVYESVSRTEHQLCPDVIDDANQDWEVRKIIGREHVDGVLHYLVEWCPTLEPEHSLGHAKEIVDEFEAQLLEQRSVKSGRRGLGLKARQQTTVEADASCDQQQKKRRGRPRKQH